MPLLQTSPGNPFETRESSFASMWDAEDDDDGEEDGNFGIGGDDDVMDEVDAFLEAHDSGLSAADQELAKGKVSLFYEQFQL